MSPQLTSCEYTIPFSKFGQGLLGSLVGRYPEMVNVFLGSAADSQVPVKEMVFAPLKLIPLPVYGRRQLRYHYKGGRVIGATHIALSEGTSP
jgi:hypothetical protein